MSIQTQASSSSILKLYLNYHIEGPRTILVAENQEYDIENNFIIKSPYIRTIKAKIGENEVK
jgi:hypothetical protein